MPLVGVVDPSHSEMARDTMGRLPNWLPLDEALAAAEDPKWAPWTQVLLRGMFAEHQERDYISTSMLVSHCPRAEVLKRKFDYVDDLESMYVPFRGTMVHRTMELYAGPGDIAEQRFWTTIDGIEVSCSPDVITAEGTLYDYKVTDSPPMYYPWTNHTEQVNINAYIVRHAERSTWVKVPTMEPAPVPDIKRVGLVYMSPKQPKVLIVEKTEDTFNAKTGKFGRGKVSYVWPDSKVEKLVKPRLAMMQAALAEPAITSTDTGEKFLHLPEGAQELWGGDNTFRCPGAPLCRLPNCIAKRYPDRLIWPREDS